MIKSLILFRECMVKSGFSCVFIDFWRVEFFYIKILLLFFFEKLMFDVFLNVIYSMLYDLDIFLKVSRVEVKLLFKIDLWFRKFILNIRIDILYMYKSKKLRLFMY